MKNLLLIFGLFCLNTIQAQITDTMICVQGIDTLQYSVDYDNQNCIDSCDSYYYITPLIGSGNYDYQVTGNSGFNSVDAIEADMCPDDYICVVTDLTSGIACTILFSIDTAIAPPPLPPLVHSIDLTNCSATGVCDGEAELTISGGNPPYIITWYDASQTPIPFEDSIVLDSLCAGNYFYSISNTSNGGGCGNGFPGDTVVGSGLIPFTINEGLIVELVWTEDEMCQFTCDGFAQVQATGGTGNYTYEIGFQSGSLGFFGNLCPNSYTVTVIDDQGNVGSTTFEIFPAMPSFGFATVTNETCLQSCDGTIIFENSTGDLIQYSIDGGSNYSFDLNYSNLCPDTYSLSALNFNGCYVPIGDYTIAAGDGPVINSIETSIASGVGNNDGCITQIDASGGAPSYTYSINGNMTTLPACNLSAGIYQVCVSDQNGCETCESIEISECDLSAQATFSEPNCAGNCDGLASVFINGANGPVIIDWQDGSGNTIGNMETINNLCAGTYYFFVTDSLGCVTSGSVNLIEPSSIIINTTVLTGITTDAACLGSLKVEASGSHENFTYKWFKCETNTYLGAGAIISNLCPGEYYAKATDIEGCNALSSCDTIQEISGIKENKLLSFEIYPNPAKDVFVIETQISGEYLIRILDLSGKVVSLRNVSKSTTQISSKNEQLTPGVYFIEVDQENVKLRKRIIIQ